MSLEDIEGQPSSFNTSNPQADFQRFTLRLVGLARKHLDTQLRHKIDPEDVVQSVYKSFFLRYGEGELVEHKLDELWSLLTVITLRKCADRVRYYQAERRNVNRETPNSLPDSIEPWRKAIDREPTPEEAALMAETVEQILAGLQPSDRPIIELSLQGYSTQEISKRMGRAERSVRRVRALLKSQLEQMQNGVA
jgi:RNA polymerase sigma-70 factor (ECF subfamily)